MKSVAEVAETATSRPDLPFERVAVGVSSLHYGADSWDRRWHEG